MAIDILCATYSIPVVGYLESKHVTPIIGNDALTPVGQGVLSTNIEIFHYENQNGQKITLLQQRSAVLKGHNKDYVFDLVQWIKSNKFSEIILLSSTSSNYRTDEQISGPQLRYLTLTDKTDIKEKDYWKELEDVSYNVCLKKGTVSRLLHERSKEENLPFTFITYFSGGFNIMEGKSVANVLVDYLNLDKNKGKSISKILLLSNIYTFIELIIPSSLRETLKEKPFNPFLFG